MALKNPAEQFKTYSQELSKLESKWKRYNSVGASILWGDVEKIDNQIEKLEKEFKKKIPEAREAGVGKPKLSDYEKNNADIKKILTEIRAKRVELAKAVAALDEYCNECYGLANDCFKKTGEVSAFLKKNPAGKGSDASTKNLDNARKPLAAREKQYEAMVTDLRKAQRYQEKPGRYIRDFIRDKNDKILHALFDQALKKMKEKETGGELPIPVQNATKKSNDAAGKLKKSVERTCKNAVHAWDPKDEGKATELLKSANFQAEQFAKIINYFDRCDKKFKKMITGKKNIEAVKDTLDKLREMEKDTLELVRDAKRDIEKKKSKKK